MEEPAKNALSAELTAAFGIPCTVTSIDPAPSGANSATHRVVRTAEGSTFSIKISTRMAASGGDRNEYLANALATRLDLRGASDARRLASVSALGQAFAGRSAIAVRWGTTDSAPISQCRAAISSNQESFLDQLGCWAVFTTMIGVTDRGAQNIIWSATSGTLAHIDFEDSFRGSDNLQEQLQAAKEFGGLDGNAWRVDPSNRLGLALSAGVRRGSEMLTLHRAEIIAAMQSEGIEPEVVSKAIAWIDTAADEKVRRVRESVG